ncbi:uncharacterized protein F4807DRAFT_91619 [Annulohypoxylon truncatum]|uniref:uncharacterized protein n=1 Tax=Annulohypoxylon truncatum TaxID=327061 RepID=UPI00200896B4|nr:uncharacterized protein F4807DRAFT_91619 [Annulohypoxylon truncatum]KAI1209369.1 hypothetical protein F4807DRAFT_91619 [Annulohypoxylon truncatum]
MDHIVNRDRQVPKRQRLPFPPDIFLRICSFLSPSDARSLRLCCKTLANIGARYGFRNITLYVNKSDFDMLRAFSRHPVISKNIRTLTYMPETLLRETHPLYYSIQEYANFSASNYYMTKRVKKSKQNWLPNGALDNLPISIEDIQENYRHYMITAQEQFQIVDGKEDFALLKEVLPKLTSLEGIYVGSSPYKRRYFSPFFAWTMDPSYELPVQAIMYGLSGSGLRLRRLEIDGLLPSILNTGFLQQLSPSCKYLKSIDLLIEEDTEDYDEVFRVDPIFEKTRHEKEPGALAKFLKALPNLEEIDITWDTDDWEARYPLREVIYPGSRWSNLRDINLHKIRTERQELIAFFTQHRLTLQKVSIGYCVLESTSCRILLCQMKEILKLTDICIYNIMEGRFENGEDNTGFIYVPNRLSDPFRQECDPFGQEWWFSDPPDPECLGTKVADWFLRDAPCPLVPGIQYLEDLMFASPNTKSDIH